MHGGHISLLCFRYTWLACTWPSFHFIDRNYRFYLTQKSRDFIDIYIINIVSFFPKFTAFLLFPKLDQLPHFPSKYPGYQLPFLFHSRYISRHFVVNVIWRLPVWNVKIRRYLASCTLQFESNLTKDRVTRTLLYTGRGGLRCSRRVAVPASLCQVLFIFDHWFQSRRWQCES
jgi:hypothetical protein